MCQFEHVLWPATYIHLWLVCVDEYNAYFLSSFTSHNFRYCSSQLSFHPQHNPVLLHCFILPYSTFSMVQALEQLSIVLLC